MSRPSSQPSSRPHIVLITGATAGIGRTTALHLARHGYHVIATGRRTAELDALRAEAPAGARLDTTVLDVTSTESIARAVAEVDRLTDGHGVDVLVNNAGFGLVGPLTEIPDGELRRQYDTNVFGLMAVTRAFVPAMRARGRGRIVNVSSMGGKMTFPFMGAYNSTKYAVESLSDALRYELAPLGIDVVLIEPGVIHTNFADTSMKSVPAYQDTIYGPAIAKADQLRARMEATGVGPEVVARAIHKAIRRRRPAARYVTPWYGRVVMGLLAVTPTRVRDAAMRKMSFLTASTLAQPDQLHGATVRAQG
ncbi:MAG TPA: SDR family oxidoreductase [Kofleriaceae bacterium]|nr:SDR family oxidoreductase [Kofleriaceae bacterium]